MNYSHLHIPQGPDELEKMIVKLRRPKNINKLDDLDLAEFARQLEADGKGKKLNTLLDIAEELRRPFKDPRRSYMDCLLTWNEIFDLLTGETERTLRPDMLIVATVNKINPGKVWCKLDSGLDAFIKFSNLSDTRPDDMLVSFGMPRFFLCCPF